MAIPDFVPLIGSGFDQLGAEQLQWANFSRGVEEANLARAQRAEEQQGNWMQAAAAFAQRRDELNQQRQLDANLFGRQLALTREQEVTRQKERTEDIGIRKDELKQQFDFGKKQLEQQQKIAQEKLDAAANLHKFNLENDATRVAMNYLPARKAHEAAQAALENLHTQLDIAQTGLEEERAKKKPDANKIIDFNNRVKLYTGQLRQREMDARNAEKYMDQIATRAGVRGFDINEDGTITHPDAPDKVWNWKTALKEAQKQPPSAATPLDLSSVLSQPNVLPPEMAGSPWAGFTQGTGTNPPPEASPLPSITPMNIDATPVGGSRFAPSPLKVGRYTATPMDATAAPAAPRGKSVNVGDRYTATPIEE